jgi:hypothetical protein
VSGEDNRGKSNPENRTLNRRNILIGGTIAAASAMASSAPIRTVRA